MNEKPILFSGEMVKAILAGNKTQTRRKATVHDWPTDVTYAECGWGKGKSPRPKWLFTDDGAFKGFSINCPYGEPGDRLWVRETFCNPGEDIESCQYRADEDDDFVTWKPSIFMPRKFSRITLEVVSVRVERLNDISNADALAEGCSDDYDACKDSASMYHELWERINGKGSWDANPWVWVLAFKKISNAPAEPSRNEDARK